MFWDDPSVLSLECERERLERNLNSTINQLRWASLTLSRAGVRSLTMVLYGDMKERLTEVASVWSRREMTQKYGKQVAAAAAVKYSQQDL